MISAVKAQNIIFDIFSMFFRYFLDIFSMFFDVFFSIFFSIKCPFYILGLIRCFDVSMFRRFDVLTFRRFVFRCLVMDPKTYANTQKTPSVTRDTCSNLQNRYEPRREKTNKVISDQVWHKPSCTALQMARGLNLDLGTRGIVLSK